MIIYRYIIRELILPFLYSLAIIVFIFMMQLAVQLLGKILYKGLDISTIIELFLINMAWMLVLAVPMAVLVTTLMTFGRMSADNEILAIKASGQNLFYLISPVFAASVILCVGMIFFHNQILPDANHRSANLMSDISRKRPAALIEPNILIRDFENYAMIVEKVEHTTGIINGVKIFSDVPGEDPAVTIADSGLILLTLDEQYLQLILYNGETHSTSRNNEEEYVIARFSKHMIFIPNIDSKLNRTERNYRGDREKSAQLLLKDINSFKERNKNSRNTYNNENKNILSTAIHLDSIVYDSIQAESLHVDTISSFTQWRQALHHTEGASIRQLKRHHRVVKRTIQQIDRQKRRISQYLVEVHKKYSVSFACIVFILIGIPLGIMAKKGGIMVSASYSLFFFVLFWIFLIAGEKMADKLIVDPILAMWASNIVIGIFGIFLILRMVKESTFINYAPLTLLWQKLFHRKNSNHLPKNKTTISSSIYRIPVFILNKLTGTLPSYLIRIFLKNIIGVFFSLIAVFVVIDYISNLRIFEKATILDILLYYWYYLAWFLGLIFPIGVLMASMFSMGILSKNSELVAIKAAGISIRRLTIPLLFLGLCLSFFSFYLSEKILPTANAEREQLIQDIKSGRRKDKSKKHESRDFRRNFYYFGNKNAAYHFQEFRVEPQNAKNIVRIIFKNNSIVSYIEADNLIYHGDRNWSFVNGTIKTFINNKFKLTVFDTLTDSILTANPTEMVARIKGVESMSYWELKTALAKAQKRGENVSKYEADMHFKVALPFMNFIVMLLGLSITARSGRKEGTVNFGIGLALVFTYWIFSEFILALGKNGTLDPLTAAWTGNVLFLIIGFFLYQRASQ